MGGIVKNAPNSLIWVVTVCFLGILASFVVLAVTGSDATDLRTFINTASNILTVALSGGALIGVGAAVNLHTRDNPPEIKPPATPDETTPAEPGEGR